MSEQAEGSFLLSCINALLREAERTLELPEPERFIDDGFRSAEEIARQAASNLMRTPSPNSHHPALPLGSARRGPRLCAITADYFS